MSSSKVRLVAVGGVLIAAVLAAAVFLLVRHSGAGPGDPPAGEGLWWEDLLRFVPTEPLPTEGKTYGMFGIAPPQSEGAVTLVDLASIEQKLGAFDDREALCDFMYGDRNGPRKDLMPLMLPYLRLPETHDGFIFHEAGGQDPRATVGFGTCQLDHVLILPTVSVYKVRTPEVTVANALLNSAYTRSTFGTAAVFSKREDWAFEKDDPLMSALNRVALSNGYVVIAPATDLIEHVLSARQGPRRSGYADPPTRGLLQGLGDVDEVTILSQRPNSQDASETSVEALRSLTPGEYARPGTGYVWRPSSVGADEWNDFPAPASIALGSVVSADGADVMKVALFYWKSGDASAAKSELEKRLQTYRRPYGGQLCDSVEVATRRVWEGTAVVGTCAGGAARRWSDLLRRGDVLFLASHIEWPGEQQ